MRQFTYRLETLKLIWSFIQSATDSFSKKQNLERIFIKSLNGQLISKEEFDFISSFIDKSSIFKIESKRTFGEDIECVITTPYEIISIGKISLSEPLTSILEPLALSFTKLYLNLPVDSGMSIWYFNERITKWNTIYNWTGKIAIEPVSSFISPAYIKFLNSESFKNITLLDTTKYLKISKWLIPDVYNKKLEDYSIEFEKDFLEIAYSRFKLNADYSFEKNVILNNSSIQENEYEDIMKTVETYLKSNPFNLTPALDERNAVRKIIESLFEKMLFIDFVEYKTARDIIVKLLENSISSYKHTFIKNLKTMNFDFFLHSWFNPSGNNANDDTLRGIFFSKLFINLKNAIKEKLGNKVFSTKDEYNQFVSENFNFERNAYLKSIASKLEIVFVKEAEIQQNSGGFDIEEQFNKIADSINITKTQVNVRTKILRLVELSSGEKKEAYKEMHSMLDELVDNYNQKNKDSEIKNLEMNDNSIAESNYEHASEIIKRYS